MCVCCQIYSGEKSFHGIETLVLVIFNNIHFKHSHELLLELLFLKIKMHMFFFSFFFCQWVLIQQIPSRFFSFLFLRKTFTYSIHNSWNVIDLWYINTSHDPGGTNRNRYLISFALSIERKEVNHTDPESTRVNIRERARVFVQTHINNYWSSCYWPVPYAFGQMYWLIKSGLLFFSYFVLLSFLFSYHLIILMCGGRKEKGNREEKGKGGR